MSKYGNNYYDLAYYGATDVAPYLATNFIAKVNNYNSINLRWASPSGDWSKIKLTRNSFGFPVTPFDGVELDILNNKTYYAFKETDPTNYTDTTVGDNAFYYYSLFIYETKGFTWIRVGNALTISPKNYGYTEKLYQYLPEIYKTTTLGDPFGNYYNEDLYNFLSLFGFQLDTDHSYTNLLVNRYDVQKIGGTLLPAFLQQFGLEFEPEIGMQQARILLQTIALVLKEKGSKNGIVEFIKSYTGYGIPGKSSAPNPNIEGVRMGKNLMLDYNDSSFEEAIGHWTSTDQSAHLYALKEKQIKTVQLTSNVATLTIKTHDYQIGNKIYIKNSKIGIFNSTVTPVTITGITSTTISYSLTGADIPLTNVYDDVTGTYPILYAAPKAWIETNSTEYYPNRQKGILSIVNANSNSGTLTIKCGADSPITKGIPVTAGSAYTFSIYSVAGSTARNVTLGIDWYNRFGTFISSSTGSATSNATGNFSSQIVAANKVAPTNTYYAVPTISVANSAGAATKEYHYFDCAQFEQATAATYFEDARIIHITLKANRTNELINPHFHSEMSMNPNPWNITGGTFSTIYGAVPPSTSVYPASYLTLSSGTAKLESPYTNDLKQGTVIGVKGVAGITDGSYTVIEWGAATSSASAFITFDSGTVTTASRTAVTGKFYDSGDVLLVTPSGNTVTIDSWDNATNSQQMGIYYPNSDYTFSVYFQGANTSDMITLSIHWYNSSHSLISTTTGTTVNAVHLSNGDVWDRTFVTGTAPSTAAYATVSIVLNTATGNIWKIDAGLFEQSSFVLSEFDGKLGPSISTDFVWEGGNENAGRSHYYKNFDILRNRLLGNALNDQLLLGTTLNLHYAQSNT
jgi:hypothetical protein